MALEKAISKKKKSFFQEKTEKNANNLKNYWTIEKLSTQSEPTKNEKVQTHPTVISCV